MALPKEVSLDETVEIELGGETRRLYYPIGALRHYRTLTSKNWREGWDRLITTRTYADGRLRSIDVDEDALIPFLTAGLICESPRTREADVQKWADELVAADRVATRKAFDEAMATKIAELEAEVAAGDFSAEERKNRRAIIAEFKAEREAGPLNTTNEVLLGLAANVREAMCRIGNARRMVLPAAPEEEPEAEAAGPRPTAAADAPAQST